jgi:hypothetical protein
MMSSNCSPSIELMGISLQRFDPDRIAATSRVFSDDIDTDAWIMFHGTSGFNSEAIDRVGFTFPPDLISRDEIQRVVNVYEKMNWAGESGGGMPALKPFSLDYDFSGERLLFFAETSSRALKFATRDLAGGEKLRALRIAFRDLDLYRQKPDVRERHKAWMDRRSQTLATQHVVVDLDWLENEMQRLKGIRKRADMGYDNHKYGAVYALRMTTGDVTALHLHWHGSMGIETATPVPVSRIASKIVVPPDYQWNPFAGRLSGVDDYLERRDRGLLAALAAHPH